MAIDDGIVMTLTMAARSGPRVRSAGSRRSHLGITDTVIDWMRVTRCPNVPKDRCRGRMPCVCSKSAARHSVFSVAAAGNAWATNGVAVVFGSGGPERIAADYVGQVTGKGETRGLDSFRLQSRHADPEHESSSADMDSPDAPSHR